MEISILNKERSTIAIIDEFTSLIWTKRYFSCGDFELYLPASRELLDILKLGYYVQRDDDNSGMIIETIQLTTSSESGDNIIVKGRSLESLVARRIFVRQTIFDDTLQEVVRKAIYDNFIIVEPPTTSNRQIDGFIIGEICTASESIKTQVSYDNVAEWLESLCTAYGYGWRVIFNSNNEFEFQLYKGKEVSVVFGPEYDNLLSSEYVESIENYKTFARVAGEGEGKNRKKWGIDLTHTSNIDRYELYVDARDISSNDGEISFSDYNKLLDERGREKLKECGATRAFSGEVEPEISFEYKKDYNLGDIVTVENGYGISSTPRIIEITESWDSSGKKLIPTFTQWEV